MLHTLNFIDLFAGAGGLSEGFIRAGFTPLAHIEMDKYACDTLKTRAAFHWLKSQDKLSVYEKYLREKQEKEDGSKLWQQVPAEVINTVIQATIGETTVNDIFSNLDNQIGNEQIDIIIGGPPCQTYSRASSKRRKNDGKKDPRHELYLYYVKFLERYHPKMFVFENVTDISSAEGGTVLNNLKYLVKQAGYEMDSKKLIASKYGVLQERERLIIVGWKKKDEYGNSTTNFRYPDLNEEDNPYQVLKDLFSDLPKRQAGEGLLCEAVTYTKPLSDMKYLQKSGIRSSAFEFTTQHITRSHNKDIDLKIFKIAIDLLLSNGIRLEYKNLPNYLQTHTTKDGYQDRFKVVDPNGFSHTVTAHIAKDGIHYIYPDLNQIRSISVREAARIQSFPDDYYFEGSRSSAFNQIGNAVPVLLAEKIAREIKKIIDKD